MTYEYASVRVIFGSGTLVFRFNSGELESGRNLTGFKTGTVLGRVRVVHFRFILSRVTTDRV